MEWKISKQPVPYEEAVHFMEARVEQIRAGTAPELVWLLTHPALYTAGTSARDSDLVDTLGFPVYKTGRGGQYTYHGPGQRVAYVMLDLKKRTPDVRLFVKNLEQWVIETLAALGVKGETRDGRVGVWVEMPMDSLPPCGGGVGRGDSSPPPARLRRTTSPVKGEVNSEAKIAALGVRLKHWVSYHGISINVNPNLSHYRGIVPCGISEYGVTSLAALGNKASMQEVDKQLKATFETIF